MGAATSRSLRRELRRKLRTSVVGIDANLELVSARNVSVGSKDVVVGRSSARDGADFRGIYFEEIGAAVIPALSDAQVMALEAEGAVVLSNDLIELGEPPLGTVSSAGADDWHLQAVGIESARSRRLTGLGVTVGVLDTGIDPDHPEFRGKSIEFCEFDEVGLPKSSSAIDFQWHGTHVSALIAGASVGVAPDANLAVAAVLTTQFNGKMVGYAAQVLGGLNWLASQAAKGEVDIVNVSLGDVKTNRDYFAPFLQRHIEGRLVVAAVGNDGAKGVGYHLSPGCYEFVLTVGACDAAFDTAPFSAWGEAFDPSGKTSHKPDVMAPGVRVRSAVPRGAYAEKNGTSMACPVVSGAAALLIQHDRNLRRAPLELKKRVLELTRSLPESGANSDRLRYGRGRLDLSGLS